MTEAPEAKSEFKLILNGVQPDLMPAVAHELTILFPLDLPTATNIAQNTPVILLDKLSPQQARNVGSYTIRLKALGADVQLTSQPVGKLQVLRWPVMPDIARRPATHIICPNCGSRLQVQLHTPVSQAQPAPSEPAPNLAPTSAPAPPVPQPAPVVPRPQPAPSAAAPVATPSAIPSTPPAAARAPASTPPNEVQDEEVVLEPVVGKEGDLLDLSEDEIVASSRGSAGTAPGGPPVGGEGSCRVTLIGRVRGQKRMQAAELMAHYLGITKEEALTELGKSVVTVAKDLTPKQAETCKNKFTEIGVRVTIKG